MRYPDWNPAVTAGFVFAIISKKQYEFFFLYLLPLQQIREMCQLFCENLPTVEGKISRDLHMVLKLAKDNTGIFLFLLLPFLITASCFFLPLQLIHSQVVDTSIVFPHRLGPPYKRALRNLMAEHLQKIIQDSG